MVLIKLISSNLETVWKTIIFQSIKFKLNWPNTFKFTTLTYWFEKLWNLEASNNLTSRTQQKWFRRNPRSFAKFQFLRAWIHSDYSEFSTGHIFWFTLWNLDFSDSLERYHQLDHNVFGFTKIRIVLHPVHSIEVWNRIIELPRHFQFYL